MSEIIDIHTHPFSCPLDYFLREMERAGARCATILFSIRDPNDVDRPEIRKRIGSRLASYDSAAQERIFEGMRRYIASLPSITNRDSAELVKKYPGKFIGFGSALMHQDEYLEEKLREVESLNLSGLKLLPTLQLFNPAESRSFERICEWCEQNGKVIMYHTGCDPGAFELLEVAEDANPKYLAPVLERYRPKIVLAHMGAYSAYRPGVWFDEALNIMKRFDNAWADTAAAGSIIFTKENIERIRSSVGFDRVLFGTDFPVVGGSSMRSEAHLVGSSPYLTDEEKRLILAENAKRLLNLQ